MRRTHVCAYVPVASVRHKPTWPTDPYHVQYGCVTVCCATAAFEQRGKPVSKSYCLPCNRRVTPEHAYPQPFPPSAYVEAQTPYITFRASRLIQLHARAQVPRGTRLQYTTAGLGSCKPGVCAGRGGCSGAGTGAPGIWLGGGVEG